MNREKCYNIQEEKGFLIWIAWPPDPIPNPQTGSPKLPASRKDWLFWQYSFGEHNT